MTQPVLILPLLALVLSAPAFAEDENGIILSGRAAMGLVGGSGPNAPNTGLYSDLDLDGRAAITTDGGLTFGIEFDLDDLMSDRHPDAGSRLGGCGGMAAPHEACIGPSGFP